MRPEGIGVCSGQGRSRAGRGAAHPLLKVRPMRPAADVSQPTRNSAATELSAALASCRGAFIATAVISAMSNILMLTGAIFMLQVYDRVLPSRSVPTLIGLAILAIGLYAALGLLDLIRGRILTRVGISLDEALSGQLYRTIVPLPALCGLPKPRPGESAAAADA